MANAKGRLAEAYTGSHATDLGLSYPNPGAREEDVYQSSPNSGGWYVTTAQHYANGVTSTLTMPGAVPAITYGLDGEGRPSTVSAASGQNPVTAASYSALGVTALTLGSGDSDGYTYDASTGRMTQYVFTVDGATDTGALSWNANGSLGTLAITDDIAGTGDSQSCGYTRDDLGRLAAVACTGGSDWSQTFAYDAFGNLAKSGTQSFGASYASSNRIATDISFAPNYDSDGNLEDDPVTATRSVNSYDAEGKAVTLEGVSVLYDALGRAVEAGSQELVYGPGGSKLAVMSGQTLERADIPLPGGGEAVYNGSGLAYYRHADHLGSSRLASTPHQALYASTAYAPYGEAYNEAGTTDLSYTGQKQDISGGQYDFLMREQNPIQGRWWTPDPAGLAAVDPNNPQSWNRYAYVNGNPLEATDPNGLCPTGTHDATGAEMAAAIAVAASYGGDSHSNGAHFGAGTIDCSGLVMCALAGVPNGSPPATSYIGLNLTTRNIDQWTDPGTGAVGDIIYFAQPGHVGIVTGPNQFFGAQTSRVSVAPFGPQAPYWGNPLHTSAPEFRRACIADQQTTTPDSPDSGGGGSGGPGGGAAGPSGGSGGSGPFNFLGLGGLTGNWANIIDMVLQAIMPNGTVSVGQCEVIGGKKACF